MTAASPAEAKLRAARTRLVLEKPFLGALVVHLPIEPVGWCESIATDARTLYFNAAYVGRLSFAQTQFAIAHVALHCALGHFARRSHRVRKRWDIACDYAVNALLVDEGMSPPPGALVSSGFRGLSAEEIYPLIDSVSEEQTLDRHAFDGISASGRAVPPDGKPMVGDGTSGPRPEGFSDDMLWSDAGAIGRRNPALVACEPGAVLPQELAQTWQMRLASAAQQAQRAGRLGAQWQRLLGRMLEPLLPWRVLLARFLAQVAHEDYSFQRPARRDGAAILPRLHGTQCELIVVLDTSGSIGQDELRAFVNELDALKGQVHARITVHACDHALAAEGPWISEAWECVRLPERLAGGGGTDFRPAFDWIERAGIRLDALLYFTDAEGEFPAMPPAYPVLWLIKGRATVPWGERIQLN